MKNEKKRNKPLINEKSGFGSADLKHGEAVRERMRRVPDHEDGAVAEDAEDGLQEPRFVVGVEVCGGFVEEEDAGAAEELAGEGEAEAFARGEIAYGFREHGVELAGERADHGIGPGGIERGEDRGVVRGRGASEREICAERGGDELGEGAEVSDPAAQGTDIVVVEGTAVEKDGAGNGLVETEEEREECAFPRAGRTGDEEF